MVGFVMEVFLDPNREFNNVEDPIFITPLNVSTAIKDSILANFGECVKYVNPITKLCIIRASREEYQKVWSAITMVRSIGNCLVMFNLLDFSGYIQERGFGSANIEEQHNDIGSLGISSLILVLVTGGGGDRSIGFIYGDQCELGLAIKFFSILICFSVVFRLNVQSIRYYSLASILVNVPYKKIPSDCAIPSNSSPHYIDRTANRVINFWSLGLRAFYFSFPLVLWIRGPIPMFIC